jgi:hypothetical protein
MKTRNQILVPMSLMEIREIIQVLKDKASIKATLKVQLLTKLHYHEDWFPVLNQVSQTSLISKT